MTNIPPSSQNQPEPKVTKEVYCGQCSATYRVRGDSAMQRATAVQWQCPTCKHHNTTRFPGSM